MSKIEIPTNFRKLGITERRELLADQGIPLPDGEPDPEFLSKADAMVESAIGFMPVPLGIVKGLVVNGKARDLPVATEEPSVIAAANYAAKLTGNHGGITAKAGPQEMIAQLYLKGLSHRTAETLSHSRGLFKEILDPVLSSMEERGGGFRDMQLVWMPKLELYRLHVFIDVQDAMGANILNTAAEKLKKYFEMKYSAEGVLAILSNHAAKRMVTAEFSLPIEALKKSRFTGEAAAERIVLLSDIAATDPYRAVTHNKGIMNAVTGLALATGNDTRAIEAGVHQYAAENGVYTSLSTFIIEKSSLKARLHLPLPIATTGGSITFHPVSQWSKTLIGTESGVELAELAGALGLAQNFAALYALATEGIQKGHMRLHTRKTAYLAGARDRELEEFAAFLLSGNITSVEDAKTIFEQGRPWHE